jgi:anti-sigma B factor antagonist
MSDFTATGTGRPDVGIVRAQGQLDGAADEALTSGYEAATLDAAPAVVLDLTDVDYINSTGIALIVALLGRARSEGRELRVSGLTDHYRHIFEITRLADLVPMYATVDEAVAGGAVPLP